MTSQPQAVTVDPAASPAAQSNDLVNSIGEGKKTVQPGDVKITIAQGLRDIRFWMLLLVLLITNCKESFVTV
jgi:hypothetical protein